MNQTEKIRILCVDDHPIVLDGLNGVLSLQEDFEVVGLATDGDEAIALFQKQHPDVVLMDLRLRNETGLGVMQRMRDLSPGVRIVVLTSLEGDADVERALANGALGYIVKGCSRDELARAVRAVNAGKRYLQHEVASKLAEHVASESLTPRELEVLNLMVHGMRNKEIGVRLHIAEDTVKMHVRNLLAKLGADDRTEAVTVALRRGLAHLP